MNNYYIGIDLGTTNTVVTIGEKNPLDNTLIRKVVKIKQYDNLKQEIFDEILPSVLYGDGEEIYVGTYPKEMKKIGSQNVIFNSKRAMGTNIVFPLNNKYYQAWEAAAEILKSCRDSICEANFTTNIKEAIITVPASFDHDKINDTKKAAEKAGFDRDKVHVLHEPTAALIDFVYNASTSSVIPINFNEKKRLFVFDLGGGTCDISIIDTQVINDEIVLEEKALSRYEEVGGMDFDLKYAEFLLETIKKEELYEELTSTEKKILFDKLVVFAEQTKEFFSNKINFMKNRGEHLDFNTLEIKRTFINFIGDKDITLVSKYSDYIQAVRSLLYKPDFLIKTNEELDKNKNIESPILETISKYNIDMDSIDFVYLTGGMSNFQIIKERVKDILDISENKIMSAYDPIKSVSFGASIYHYYKVREKKLEDTNLNEEYDEFQHNEILSKHSGIKPKQVFSEAIMINILEGLPKIVIPENKEYPCKDMLHDILKTTSPSGIKIEVYCGENEFDTKMRKQKVYLTRFEKPVQTGSLLDIDYSIDEDKSLDMKLIVKSNEIQTIPLSRVEHMDIKTIDDKFLISNNFTSLNSSINRLFYYITPENFVRQFSDLFNKYALESFKNYTFKEKFYDELFLLSMNLLDLGINPIETLLYSSKICNEELNKPNSPLALTIKRLVQDIIGKDKNSSINVINHILEKWSWIPQLSIIYKICSESKQEDLIRKCYASYKSGEYENSILKLDIANAMILSGSNKFLSEIFDIVYNLDNTYRIDSEIWKTFDEKFISLFTKEDVAKIISLSSYIQLNNRYSQNLFARLKRNSEKSESIIFDSNNITSVVEDLNSEDGRKRRKAFVEARFVKSNEVSLILYNKLKFGKSELSNPEIKEALISLAFLYIGKFVNLTEEEIIQLYDSFENDKNNEYLSAVYACKIILGIYDRELLYKKLIDNLAFEEHTTKDVISIIRQIRHYKYNFPENFKKIMLASLKNEENEKLQKYIQFYSRIYSESVFEIIDIEILNLLHKPTLEQENKEILYRTILIFIKKNRNYQNMNLYNKILFTVLEDAKFNDELRSLANEILKTSEIKEGI